ncbi:hypothetical protein Lgra_0915 [Legionella gratiana]|uniref:Pirin n=1 Tax=Legionella gratiana TaxID=45066 RepID=A0A378JN82_9GAMM|nr:hypothetical protein Lgra_0915 [Legionella gratiana]STX46220.1 pirin [Legionella gratiana]
MESYFELCLLSKFDRSSIENLISVNAGEQQKMSYFNVKDPICMTKTCPEQIRVALIPRTVDLGGFQVGRVLPSKEKRTVGPFVFWDQAGPNEFCRVKSLLIIVHIIVPRCLFSKRILKLK